MTIKESDLAQFYGTETYHQYIPPLILTDGVLFLAQNGECFWLLDIIVSLQYTSKFRNDEDLQYRQFWKLKVNEDSSAVVTCERDTDDVVYTQNIEYTDFPFDVQIWLCEYGNQFVAMLPSEY